MIAMNHTILVLLAFCGVAHATKNSARVSALEKKQAQERRQKGFVGTAVRYGFYAAGSYAGHRLGDIGYRRWSYSPEFPNTCTGSSEGCPFNHIGLHNLLVEEKEGSPSRASGKHPIDFQEESDEPATSVCVVGEKICSMRKFWRLWRAVGTGLGLAIVAVASRHLADPFTEEGVLV